MKPPRVAHPRQVLIVQLRRLGDVVLTTALLEDLRRAFPHTPVDFLVGDRAAPLLQHHPWIRERVIYDRAHPTRTWHAVRGRRYDWIVDPQSSPRTAPLALVSAAPVRAGFGVRGWGWVYTHRLPRAGRPVEYVPRERQRLLEMLGVSSGFLYSVSETGVTGALGNAQPGASPLVLASRQAAALRKRTGLPVVVGFGISTRDQVRQVAKDADGVVVGSALVNVIKAGLADRAAAPARLGAVAADLVAGTR